MAIHVKFHKPKNKVLQKYIEGFYFLSAQENSPEIRYWTFPNNCCILTFNQNFEVEVQDQVVYLNTSKQPNSMTSLVSRYTEPMQIRYKELIDEVTIYFKPLGINQFVKDTQYLFSKKTHLNFIFSPDFNEAMQSIINKEEEAEQIEELERFLVSKLQEQDLSRIASILQDVENDLRIEDIALKNNVSRQYINRIFRQHLGKSPSEYRKVHRFRNALVHQKKTKNYAELSQYGFYDQSHFIKDFRQLTHTNPQLFFENVDTEKENIWFFD